MLVAKIERAAERSPTLPRSSKPATHYGGRAAFSGGGVVYAELTGLQNIYFRNAQYNRAAITATQIM